MPEEVTLFAKKDLKDLCGAGEGDVVFRRVLLGGQGDVEKPLYFCSRDLCQYEREK